MIETQEDHAQTGTALAPTGANALVLPVANPRELVHAMRQYQETKNAILEPSDYQDAGRGQKFIKKSGFAKLAIAFGASSTIVSRHFDEDADGNLVGAEFVVRAIAPNGRFAEGWGYCSIDEPRFTYQQDDDRNTPPRYRKGDRIPSAVQKLRHDLCATSETRSRNRAYSALFGHGEVSWEEVTGDGVSHQPIGNTGAPAPRALGSSDGGPPRAGLASEKQVKWVRDLCAQTGQKSANLEGLTIAEFNAMKDGLSAQKNGGPKFTHPRLGAGAADESVDADFTVTPVAPASGDKPASTSQLATIEKMLALVNRPGTPIPDDLTSHDAGLMIAELSREWNANKEK